jgi:Sad1 / UNC-like C-terminal
MFGFTQALLFYWVRQHAVIAALRSAFSHNCNLSYLLRRRKSNNIIVMTGGRILQVLKWVQVWMLLAPTFLAHVVQTQEQATSALTCPVPKFDGLEFPTCSIYEDSNTYNNNYNNGSHVDPEPSVTASDPSSSTAAPENADVNELDAESLLDNAKFLSFEDWKKQNLAKNGQSADNVGSKRQGGDISSERRTEARVMNNALDALGDDAEIDLNFGGAFGSDASQPAAWESGNPYDSGTVNTDGEPSAVDGSVDGVSGVGRRKDAGTTCKERFNYASFDCAATVLRTNPQCSGSSSILIENKDSYMLNECRAKEKFLILELCDDILVDTIVLANYEFFSSIFHTFKVSVSDRYPVKGDKWKEFGIFEAKNTREVQAFAIENPLIWARYVKIDFLTHYGNEFYCPLSLVRVHGTTMLEEYKNEGDISRSDEEILDEVAEEVAMPVEVQPVQEEVTLDHPSDNFTLPMPVSDYLEYISPLNGSILEIAALNHFVSATATCSVDEYLVFEVDTTSDKTHTSTSATGSPAAGGVNATIIALADSKASADRTEQPTNSETNTAPRIENQNVTSRGSGSDSSMMRTSIATGENSTSTLEPTKVAPSPPPSPNPTTQESFFKSVNKRLQMLESNSSLSLLYIEEQSRMLRDAFSKVEKRQLAKMNSFLEDLNATVVEEIRNLQSVYQSLSTIVLDDFEHQQREVSSASTQLAILTNELVFQKRMTALSSVLIMILFALILFPRGTGIVGIDLPSMMAWSPRPSSPAKVSRTPTTGASSPALESETPTPPPSNRSTSRKNKKKTHQRQCSNALHHNSIKDLRNCSNPLAHSPEDDIHITGYDNDGRFRSLSDFSDSEINKIPYTPFSPDLRHMLGYDAMRPNLRVAKQASSSSSPSPSPALSLPSLQQDRPVSSPPVLKEPPRLVPATNSDDNDGDSSDAESDASIEPFPPFPSI